MKITADLLRANDACPDQITRFAQLWPDGAAVTLENLATARTASLDVDWLRILLPPEFQLRWDALYAEFRPRWDALYAEFQPRRAALYVEAFR